MTERALAWYLIISTLLNAGAHVDTPRPADLKKCLLNVEFEPGYPDLASYLARYSGLDNLVDELLAHILKKYYPLSLQCLASRKVGELAAAREVDPADATKFAITAATRHSPWGDVQGQGVPQQLHFANSKGCSCWTSASDRAHTMTTEARLLGGDFWYQMQRCTAGWRYSAGITYGCILSTVLVCVPVIILTWLTAPPAPSSPHHLHLKMWLSLPLTVLALLLISVILFVCLRETAIKQRQPINFNIDTSQ